MIAPHLPPLSKHPTVGLVMEASDTKTAWAIIRSSPEAGSTVELHTESERLDADGRRKLMMASVDAAVEFAADHGGTVDLAVYHSGARNELLELGGVFGPVFVLARSAIAFDNPAYLHVVDEAHTSIGKFPAHAPGHVTAATDGAYHRRYGGGAFGWVSSDGRHWYGSSNARSSLEAELHAVLNLITATRTGSTLHVLLDSRDAIEAIGTGVVTRRKRSLPSTTLALLHHIGQHQQRVTLTLEWVKGHNGHPLNDAADRLARLARQSVIYSTPREVSARIALDIVEDALNPTEPVDILT